MELFVRYGVQRVLETAEWYDVFTADGTWDWAARGAPGKVDVLVVAGGGYANERSGGAGGVRFETGVTVAGDTNVTVGRGGHHPLPYPMSDAGDSSFGGVVAKGGGRGAFSSGAGQDGGSGGGGSPAGAGTPGQGHAGVGSTSGGATVGKAGVTLRALNIAAAHAPPAVGAGATGTLTVEPEGWIGRDDPQSPPKHGTGSGGSRRPIPEQAGANGIVIVMNHRPRPAATDAIVYLHASAPHQTPTDTTSSMPTQRVGVDEYEFNYYSDGHPLALTHDGRNYLYFAGSSSDNNLTVPTPGTGTRYWVADFLDRAQATGSSTSSQFTWASSSTTFRGHKLARVRIYQDAAHQNLLADFNADDLTEEPYTTHEDPLGNTWTINRTAQPSGAQMSLVDRDLILFGNLPADRLQLVANASDFNLGASNTITVVVAARDYDAKEQPLVSKTQLPSGSDAGWALSLRNTRIPRVYAGDGTTGNVVDSGKTVPIGRAYTVAAVFTPAQLALLVAGDAVADSVRPRSVGDASSTDALFVGRYNTAGIQYRGELFGVAIFDRALTQLELRDVAQEFRAPLIGAETTLYGPTYAGLRALPDSSGMLTVVKDYHAAEYTFTRSGHSAWGPRGLMGADTPRAWGVEALALTIEGAHESLTPNNATVSGGQGNTTRSVLIYQDDTPQQVLTGAILKATPNTSNAEHWISGNTSEAVKNQEITVSIFLRPAGYRYARFEFTTSTGVEAISVDAQAGTILSATNGVIRSRVTPAPNGWHRFEFTVNTGNGASTPGATRVYIRETQGNNVFSGDGVKAMEMFGLQTEVGPRASTFSGRASSISPVGADKLVIPVSVDWDASAYTLNFALKTFREAPSSWIPLIGFYDGSAKRIRVENTSSGALGMYASGTSYNASIVLGQSASGGGWEAYSVVFNKGAGKMTAYKNGVALSTSGEDQLSWPAVNNITVEGGNFFYASLGAWNAPLLAAREMPPAEIQAMHTKWLAYLNSQELA